MVKSPDAFRTISEVAEWLEVPTHVLRFWESRFAQVKPVKRAGGRRYYRPADMELLGGIKRLLHHDGMTIRGVQKLLREQGARHVAALSPALHLTEGVGADGHPADKTAAGAAGGNVVPLSRGSETGTPSGRRSADRTGDDAADAHKARIDQGPARAGEAQPRPGAAAGSGPESPAPTAAPDRSAPAIPGSDRTPDPGPAEGPAFRPRDPAGPGGAAGARDTGSAAGRSPGHRMAGADAGAAALSDAPGGAAPPQAAGDAPGAAEEAEAAPPAPGTFRRSAARRGVSEPPTPRQGDAAAAPGAPPDGATADPAEAPAGDPATAAAAAPAGTGARPLRAEPGPEVADDPAPEPFEDVPMPGEADIAAPPPALAPLLALDPAARRALSQRHRETLDRAAELLRGMATR